MINVKQQQQQQQQQQRWGYGNCFPDFPHGELII